MEYYGIRFLTAGLKLTMAFKDIKRCINEIDKRNYNSMVVNKNASLRLENIVTIFIIEEEDLKHFEVID